MDGSQPPDGAGRYPPLLLKIRSLRNAQHRSGRRVILAQTIWVLLSAGCTGSGLIRLQIGVVCLLLCRARACQTTLYFRSYVAAQGGMTSTRRQRITEEGIGRAGRVR